MTKWRKVAVQASAGLMPGVAPVIISASRATDIPAFYGEWLVNRLKAGYVKWLNPFNRVPQYVSFEDTRVIVFWTKNPAPIIPLLQEITKRGIHYYFTVTLNDYEAEGLEPGVPPLEERIESFIRLSELLGRQKVIWRFDPLFLTGTGDIDTLLNKIARVGNRVHAYTEQLIISFADIANYRKVRRNLDRAGVTWRTFSETDITRVAAGLDKLNAAWGLTVRTCGESVDLSEYGIAQGSCIDADLMARLFHHDSKLMAFLGGRFAAGNSLFEQSADMCEPGGRRTALKDPGQRPACLCMMAKDIGQYDTCPHHCLYCYANTSFRTVQKNSLFSTREGELITSNGP